MNTSYLSVISGCSYFVQIIDVVTIDILKFLYIALCNIQCQKYRIFLMHWFKKKKYLSYVSQGLSDRKCCVELVSTQEASVTVSRYVQDGGEQPPGTVC